MDVIFFSVAFFLYLLRWSCGFSLSSSELYRFWMLKQICIPQINPFVHDVLFFLYITGFNLINFWSFFCLHSWEVYVVFLNEFVWFCHKGHADLVKWIGKCFFLFYFFGWICILVFCCCITNYYKLSSLKQHVIISSQFLCIRSLGIA